METPMGPQESQTYKVDSNSETFRNAVEHVKVLLQTEEDLSNLAEKKRLQLIKKANVDTRLRTAIKSQLDGVKTGLQQLDAAVKDIQKVSLAQVDHSKLGNNRI